MEKLGLISFFKNKRIFVLVGMLALLSGCASQVKKAKIKMAGKFNCIIGKTEDDVIISLGKPDSIEIIGKVKIYRYSMSYGRRKSWAFYNWFDFATTSEWESYDRTDVMFKNGVAVSWSGQVQR